MKIVTTMPSIGQNCNYLHNTIQGIQGSWNISSKYLDSPCWTHEPATGFTSTSLTYRHHCLVCPALAPGVQTQEESLGRRCQHKFYWKAMSHQNICYISQFEIIDKCVKIDFIFRFIINSQKIHYIHLFLSEKSSF